ncbi:MAG: ribbon-helix-helix protein, CopG family [Geobacter sp.]|nr:ribbon-helix-helix protein, CopG family [Geobacter sp.]
MTAQAQLKPVGVKLSSEQRERLNNISRLKKRSAHWLMKEAIQQYIERAESDELFRQETLAGWEEYQRDGLHVTQAEMENWLSSWGTEDETECPACHS